MTAISLDVQPRETIGKQVKALRREGLIPAIVYGPLRDQPLPVQVRWADLRPVLSQAGGTSVIQLNYQNEAISVLVRDVTRHPFRAEVLHVDFYAVNLEAKTTATIPVTIPNLETQAKRLAAKVFQPVTRIMVECLPADLISQVPVDLSTLRRAGQNIMVKNLPALPGVTYLADPDMIVVRTVSLTKGVDEVEDEDTGPISMEVEVIKRGKSEEEEF